MELMRPLVMFNRVSADGYFADAGGKLDWVVPDDELDAEGAEGSSEVDTILFGRRTYEMFASFWPHALDDATGVLDPHDNRRRPLSPAMREMALLLNAAAKIVFSRTLRQVTWNNARIVPEFDAEAVRALKAEKGKGIMIFGSGTIVSELTRAGLIDEYHFIVNPVFLGQGKSLMNLAGRVPLDLIEEKRYGSGNVKLRYARKRA